MVGNDNNTIKNNQSLFLVFPIKRSKVSLRDFSIDTSILNLVQPLNSTGQRISKDNFGFDILPIFLGKAKTIDV